jgi:hypothetical protein
MTSPSNSAVQNLLPVQAYFDLDNNFVTFIGQGLPFYATIDPSQTGLNITNSVINSTTIGLTVPAAGAFTSFSTNTGTIASQPVGATDIVNLLALQSYAAGISWKQPCAVATLTNITLSGLQTIDTYTTLEGDRVLVKDQSTAANNGIYNASAGAWTRSIDANSWDELVAAISFIEYGTQKGGAWFCTAQPGGTLGVTAVNWSQFTTSATYTAGTGLTLTGFEFSITNTGVPASTYGSATATPVFAVNAQGQITSVTNTTITPAIGNVTGLGANVATFLATPTSANLAAAVSDETGSGALVFATSPTLVTPALGTPASGIMTNVTGLPLTTGVTGTLPIGNGGTGQTTASAAFNALSPITTTGDLIIGTGVNTASRIGIGTNGQVLTSNGTTASWATPSPGTTFSAGTTGFTPSTPTSGTVTLAGTLVAANGGTGFASYTVGDILYASTTTALSKLAGVATGNALISGGVGAAPSYGKIDLTTTVSGILPGANGGTGNGFFAVSGPATSLKTFTFPNASATVLTTNALVTVAQGGTGVGTLTGIAYGNGTSAFTAASAAQVVSVIGSTAVTNATNATNVGIVDDTTTATTVYPVWSNGTSGNQALETSSTKFSFVPSTGVLSATSFSGAGTGLTGTASGLSIGGNAATATSVSGTIAVANGGTGQTSYTNGQLLIGNTTGNTLTKATLTAGAGISITNGTGSITIANTAPAIVASYVIVAGGGGTSYSDGNNCYGGGGAGGYLSGSATLASGTTYSFTVGGGGASGAQNTAASNGTNSTGLGLTAIGGGRAGGINENGASGGSGGGSGDGAGGSPVGGSGTAGQGNNGGAGNTTTGYPRLGGGGGGAGATGGNATGIGGLGGAGTASSITGSSVTRAGGGGSGASGNGGGTPGTGGAGGGGNGAGGGGTPTAGTANTGGGGGGGGSAVGANGGSGVVIISLPTSLYTGTTTGSPTVTTSGGNTILQFNASGSYTA